MVGKSPKLRMRIKPLVAELSAESYNNGTFKPLASDKDTLDSLNVHCGLMDEIHQWKNGKALYDIIADGVTAREQPLILITSTAGTVRQDIYDAKYEEAERLINGYFDPNGYKDDHLIAFVYELEAKAAKAKENNALVKNPVCKEFNVRETSSEAWLTFEQIDNQATFDVKQLKPRYGIGGCDLSSTTDLTNATVIFMVRGDEHIDVLQMYWIPEDLVERRVREDKIPFDQWIQRDGAALVREIRYITNMWWIGF